MDACSCAGVGADGYKDGGWEVVCLDNDPHALRHAAAAGYETVEGDVLRLLADHGFIAQFDLVHASFPCQLFSATRQLAKAQGKGQGRAVDLLTPGLGLLQRWGGPYIVENVERSPIKKMSHLRLCGSSFGLKVQRHRLFHSNVAGLTGLPCDHSTFDIDPISGKPRPWGVYYAMGDNIPSGGRTVRSWEHGCDVMGVAHDRLPYHAEDEQTASWRHLCEALPPAYTQHLGKQLLEVLC